MASSLTFTSAPFLQGATYSSSNSATATRYDVISADATYARRIYGISIASSDAGANTVTIYLHDGTTSYQVYQVSVAANAGNSTSIAAQDIFGSVYGAGIFQKQRDANGVPYFNLPANWKVQFSYATLLGSGEGLYVVAFGETYA
jgi:hypothetical protein